MHDDAFTKRLPYGLGTLMLGLIGLAFGDFALQWQPTPATLPWRAVFAHLSAALLIAGGVGVLIRSIASSASLAIGFFFALWAVILHAPRVLADPRIVANWNGLAEITALAAGGAVGWALARNSFAAMQLARRIFGGCFAVFGVAHFVYADFTASMVPSWIPGQLFWAYATGAGHLAASLSLLSGRYMRIAASLLTAMLASFVVLLHIPRVIANPGSHIEWVMLAISTTLTGAAWIVRASSSRVVNWQDAKGRTALAPTP